MHVVILAVAIRWCVASWQEEKFVGLEDLFRRTEATPHLYWLPLTEEQIAAKRRRQAEAAKQKA